MRVRLGKARHRSKKRLFKEARGNVGGRSKLLRTVKETLVRARAFATRDRRTRKREFRALWITRISAAARATRGIADKQRVQMFDRELSLNRWVEFGFGQRSRCCFGDFGHLVLPQGFFKRLLRLPLRAHDGQTNRQTKGSNNVSWVLT